MKTLAFLAAMMAAVATMPAHAEERRITVSGTGTALAVPDMATLTLGVTNQDKEASNAMQATSDAVAQILTRLDEMGLESRDVQTRDLSLSPVWSNSGISSGSQREITGFVASNRVFIRVRDLNNLGQIMDAVIRDGANDFGGLSFSVQEPKPLEDKARADAVADARDKAEQLAQAAGVTLGQVVSISDQAGGIRPVAQMSRLAQAESGVPVAGGEVSVAVNVSMVFEIED
ncbi:SIMPL domain-containing protein [Ruegeria sp.]|uniref:SIMPL domain-containing protein n=1 Tax=Ruegeria sp. TaxID=1879320 RepID=UPI00230B25EA|nr:SIMPL domain-containing protein [Ruegeria sp.]MDA7966691.1 SIMPL domain-containing protein [Ruegeria sp.]